MRVASIDYHRDILWSRLLYKKSLWIKNLAVSMNMPKEQLDIEIGAEQLEECLSLSVRTPFERYYILWQYHLIIKN